MVIVRLKLVRMIIRLRTVIVIPVLLVIGRVSDSRLMLVLVNMLLLTVVLVLCLRLSVCGL